MKEIILSIIFTIAAVVFFIISIHSYLHTDDVHKSIFYLCLTILTLMQSNHHEYRAIKLSK